jgi:hypothetical protein
MKIRGGQLEMWQGKGRLRKRNGSGKCDQTLHVHIT